MADDDHNVIKFRLGFESGNGWLIKKYCLEILVVVLTWKRRRQERCRRSADSGFLFCKLLNGHSDSGSAFLHADWTVQVPHTHKIDGKMVAAYTFSFVDTIIPLRSQTF